MWQAKNLISSWFYGAIAVFIVMVLSARQAVNHIVLEFNPLVIYCIVCGLVLFPIVKYRWARVFKVWGKGKAEKPSEPRPDDDQIIKDSGRPWSVAAKRTKPKPVPTALTPQVEAKADFMDEFINFFKNIFMAIVLIVISPAVCLGFWVTDHRAGGQH